MTTQDEFRDNPELVKWMRELTEHPNFALAMEAMKSVDPVRQPAPRAVTTQEAHIMLGEQTGWAQYEIELLKLATRMPVRQETPPADYREEPEPDEQT